MNYIGVLKKVQGNEVTFLIDGPVNVEELSRFSDSDVLKAEITFDDNRRISAEQRKKAWALTNDVARYTGFNPVEASVWMKVGYMAESGSEYFSLSDCSVTTARLFISYIIEFCFLWNIPFKDKGLEMHDDINAYLWLCIKYRKCVLCGKHADIAHYEAVGMGRNRRKIDHSHHGFLALCRFHHQKQHEQGVDTFCKLNHMKPIKLSQKDLKEFKIGV